MSVVIIGMQIMWGLNREKPILPIGWHYIERRREWLLAVSPTGARYYVGAEGTLYRQLHFPGKKHPYRVDTDTVIVLPQKQLPCRWTPWWTRFEERFQRKGLMAHEEDH